MDNNLPELRDIHLPDGVSMFPPAYGWWVIIVVIFAIFAMVKLLRFVRRKSKKIYTLRLLRAINKADKILAAQQMSGILRRICVYKYKEATVLMGQEWLAFLNQHCKQKLEGKAAQLLLDAPYVTPNSQHYDMLEINQLNDFCQVWVGENL